MTLRPRLLVLLHLRRPRRVSQRRAAGARHARIRPHHAACAGGRKDRRHRRARRAAGQGRPIACCNSNSTARAPAPKRCAAQAAAPTRSARRTGSRPAQRRDRPAPAPNSPPPRRRPHDTRIYYNRVRRWAAQQLVAASEVDRARAAADNAAGTRCALRRRHCRNSKPARASSRSRRAKPRSLRPKPQVAAQQVTLGKLSVVAPRDGLVDSLPYKLGDQAPVGAPLAILLVGDAPYARVYVPEPIRANVAGRRRKARALHRRQATTRSPARCA